MRLPVERVLEVVDDFTVGYAAKRRIAITVIPSRAAMAGKGYNECSAQMSGAWNRAPDIAQQSQ
jgi:hypothetical protein